jgi:iron complex outermembrane recepter protein
MNMKRMNLNSGCWSGIAVTVLAIGGAVAAETQSSRPRVVNVDIRSQPIGTALNELARQAGLQLLFFTDVASDLKQPAPALAGTFATEEALLKLLANTGLTFSYVNERTVAVHRPNSVSRDKTTRAEALPPVIRLANDLKIAEAGNDEVLRDTGSPGGGRQNAGAETRSTSLEEVIVTAQKRLQRLQDVPISIVAMGADELQSRNLSDIDDLATAVPGLAIQSSGGHQRRIAMRGIGNAFGGSSLVGIYLNEAPITSDPTTQLNVQVYDIERIEVLRGPQGTLYGEGSVGGTLRFITRSPELDAFAFKSDVAASFTDGGDPNQQIVATVNAPIVSNQLGVRLSAMFDREGGWIDQPAADKEDINGHDLVDIRLQGLWQPTTDFSVRAMAVIHRNDTGVNAGEDSSGNFTQVFNLSTTPRVSDDFNIYNLALSFDLGFAEILSSSTYIDQDKLEKNIGIRFPFGPPGTPRTGFNLPYQFLGTEAFTQELRLTSTDEGSLHWTFGGLYRDARFDFDRRNALLGLEGPPGTPLPAPFSQLRRVTSESFALFGDLSFDVSEAITIGAGLRYFEDDQRRTDFVAAGPRVQTDTFDALTPRVYAEYNFNDNANLYASVAGGFRSGGFNSFGRPTYDPEHVRTYEVGLKSSALNRRLYAEVALFHTDYEDYQVVGILLPPALPQNVTSNAGDASINGVELTLSWRPAPDWTVSFVGNYVDTEFKAIRATSAPYQVGDPLDLIPPYTFSFSTEYEFDVVGRPASARVDYNQQGQSTFRNRNASGPTPWYFSESDVINMLNLDFRVECTERLSLSLFAQNLLDDRGFTDSLSIEESAARARPITVGMKFSAAFE